MTKPLVLVFVIAIAGCAAAPTADPAAGIRSRVAATVPDAAKFCDGSAALQVDACTERVMRALICGEHVTEGRQATFTDPATGHIVVARIVGGEDITIQAGCKRGAL